MHGEVSRGRLKVRLLSGLAMAVVVVGSLLTTGNVPAFAQGNNSGIAHRVAVLESKVAALETSNNSLQAALDAEIAARTAGDASLQNNLNAEAGARAGADAALQNNLDAEVAARTAADTDHDHKFNVLYSVVGSHANRLDELESAMVAEVAARTAADTDHDHKFNVLYSVVGSLNDKTQFISVTDGQMYVSGTNLWIQNGLGGTETTNSLGNLIIGYNELRDSGLAGNVRTGSHNLVVGTHQNYSSFGGGVFGHWNELVGAKSFVLGRFNSASGLISSVLGGHENEATGDFAVVCGGYANTASGISSMVGGGGANTAGEIGSTVSGGVGITENTGSYGWSAGSGPGTTYSGKFRSH